MIILPLIKFRDMLQTYKEQIDNDMTELIAAATLIGSRPNYLTVDEQGYYHLQASGTLEQCIKATEENLAKLNRIKAQKDRLARKSL